MTNRKLVLLGFGVLGLAMLGTKGLAQTAISSSFNLLVEADADQMTGGLANQTYADAQGTTLNPFAGSISVTHTEPGGGFVTASSSAFATWSGAGSGVVGWRDMGWIRNSPLMHTAHLNGFPSNPAVWEYTFQATANDFFVLQYNVTHTGWGFGLLGVMIAWTGPGGGQDLTDAHNPDASGTFTRPLTNGDTYTIGLINTGNIFASAGQGYSDGYLNADFAWSTSTVPEPSLLAMGTILAALFGWSRRTRTAGK